MKQVMFIILFSTLTKLANGQILDNSLFRIYRAPFIVGAVTQLRIDRNGIYELAISEIQCSLCNHKELHDLIDSKGTWVQNNDTINLNPKNGERISLLLLDSSLLKPIYPIGFKPDSLRDSTKTRIIQNIQKSGMQDFHLIYDTYPNGVARIIVDRYRTRRNEYEIVIEQNGNIKTVNYYWDGKKKKRIR
jgi:hypothetical protein